MYHLFKYTIFQYKITFFELFDDFALNSTLSENRFATLDSLIFGVF